MSSKSYDYVRAHNQAIDRLDFVPEEQEITADYAEGTTFAVPLHDGSRVVLHKLDESYDPGDADGALLTIRKRAARGEVATGLLYIDEAQQDLHAVLGTVDRPLNAIPIAELCPGSKKLAEINARLT
jgi:2-oxoglutarate ferredoxin oxidoreductase subunit beta